jgi:8-oxo-dGTP pyrophosphatase MutT (NUDIX family)
MENSSYKKVVIAFLHKDFDSYLLQLRDFKSSIIYPGHWGAFGGSIETGESPKTAMNRELIEEIGYSPEEINFFRKDYQVENEIKLNIFMFYSSIDVSLAQLSLTEGTDMAMFTREEILTRNLYSKKLGKGFPIVPLLSNMFDQFFEYIDKKIRLY